VDIVRAVEQVKWWAQHPKRRYVPEVEQDPEQEEEQEAEQRATKKLRPSQPPVDPEEVNLVPETDDESDQEEESGSGSDSDSDMASGDDAAPAAPVQQQQQQQQQAEEDAKHGQGNGEDENSRAGRAKARSVARWEQGIRDFEIANVNRPPFNRQGQFTFCAKHVALTYSGIAEDSPLTIDCVTNTLVSRFHVVQLLVGQEDHLQPGFIHFHVYLQLFKLHSTNVRIFDVENCHPFIRTIPQKGQYAGSRGRLRWISYILKQSALNKDHVRSFRFSVFSSFKTFKRDLENHSAFISYHQNLARFVPPQYPIRITFLHTPLSVNLDVQWHPIQVQGRELPAWKEPGKKRHWLIIGEPDRGKTTSIRMALTKDLSKPHGQCYSFYDVPPALNGRYDRYAGQDIILFDDVTFPTKEEILALTAFHHGDKQMSARYENAVLKGSQARVILIVANEFPSYHGENWFTSRFHVMNLDPLTIFPPPAAAAAPAAVDHVRNNSAAASRPPRSNTAAMRDRAAPIPAPAPFARVTQAATVAAASPQLPATPTFSRAPAAAGASLGLIASSFSSPSSVVSSNSASFSSSPPPPPRAFSFSTTAPARVETVAARASRPCTMPFSTSHTVSSSSWPHMSRGTTATVGSHLQDGYPGTTRDGDHTMSRSASSFSLNTPGNFARASFDGSANISPQQLPQQQQQQQQQQQTTSSSPPAVAYRSFTARHLPPPPPPLSSSRVVHPMPFLPTVHANLPRDLVFSPFPSQDAMNLLNENSAEWFA
jgi:hypothetical protein